MSKDTFPLQVEVFEVYQGKMIKPLRSFMFKDVPGDASFDIYLRRVAREFAYQQKVFLREAVCSSDAEYAIMACFLEDSYDCREGMLVTRVFGLADWDEYGESVKIKLY